MRTNFTAEQLADPPLREAAKIIGTCDHYGFCTNTCPTYVLTRDENESPRGRIELIRVMLEKGGAPDAATVRHLDSCLSCLSCMTTCAVKVDYMHLIDHARVHIERHFRRPLPERMLRALLAVVLARPRLFAALLKARGLARAFSWAMPFVLRNMLEMIPSELGAPEAVTGTHLSKAGTRRVALLAGCVQQVLSANINAATLRLLQRHGCDVVVSDGAGCCGSLALHMGRADEARRLAAANLKAWCRDLDTAGIEAIIINASGCGTTIKDYGHLFAGDATHAANAQDVARLARDVSEFVRMLTLKPRNGNFGFRVAYHDPCSIRHGQKIIEPPREILRELGFHVLDVPEAHFCCGSAGTYNLLQPQTANALGERKAQHIESTAPDIIATGNIGCMVQIGRFTRLPVLHWVELADWATGGELPPALRDVALPPPRPPQSSTPNDTTARPDVGFW
jgi:glycolate oxidase iron-sulfur subunit